MKAYSYIRWSSDPQTKGDSLARQLQRTRAVCKERGWDLDESIKPDMGVSAYTGKNLAKGSLAKFIQAVKSGKIQTPCVLCVEGLDRLTRLRVRDAKAMFDELLSMNVLICTAHNNKLYDEASLDNPIDLLFSIMELNAGHAYAAELGKKISAAWTRKKEAAAKGKLLTSRLPGWLLLNKKTGRIQIDKTKAKIVQRIFKAYLDGQGARIISLALNKEGIKPFGHGKGWSAITVRRFLTSPSVIGALQPQKYLSRTKRVPQGPVIDDYYPAVIDKATFYKVQERIKERRTTRGARKHCFNLFSGLIECAQCGWSVVLKTGAVVKEGNKKPHIRLLCSKGWRGQGCEYKTMRYEPVERGIITALMLRLLTSSQQPDVRLATLEQLQGELKDTQARIARLEKVILDEDNLPKTIVKSLADLEALEVSLKSQIAQLPEPRPTAKLSWKQLPKTLENRIYVQGLMSNEIEKISLDARRQTADVVMRNGHKFDLAWDEQWQDGFFLSGKWQGYLDELVFWESPRNFDLTESEVLHLSETEVGILISEADSIKWGLRDSASK